MNREKEEEPDFEILKMDRIENKEYTLGDVNLKDIGIRSAAGLLYHKGLIYISDIEQQVVKIYNQQFQILTEIKDGELSSPSQMIAKEDTIYVLDKRTLQVFEFKENKDLTYERKRVFVIPGLGHETDILDLEILDGKMYVTFSATTLQEAKVVAISLEDEEVTFINTDEEGFYGYVGVSEENVLNFAQTMQYYEKVGKTGFKTGESKGFFLEENDLKPRGKFLSGSMPTDFFIKDSYYYVYSAGWSSVDRYDLSLKYIDSLATFKISDSHVVLKGDSEKMFFLMIYEQKLWEINKK